MPSDQDVLFDGFSEAQKRDFLALASSRRYTPPAVVLREGEMGSEMLLVEDGQLSIWVRDAKINEVEAGSILGISSLIEPHQRTASLRAETPASVLVFTRPKVLEYLSRATPKLFQLFFANAFRIHLNLIDQCEDRIVKLSQELGPSLPVS